jgi:hypothetical protein
VATELDLSESILISRFIDFEERLQHHKISALTSLTHVSQDRHSSVIVPFRFRHVLFLGGYSVSEDSKLYGRKVYLDFLAYLSRLGFVTYKCHPGSTIAFPSRKYPGIYYLSTFLPSETLQLNFDIVMSVTSTALLFPSPQMRISVALLLVNMSKQSRHIPSYPIATLECFCRKASDLMKEDTLLFLPASMQDLAYE